MELLFNELSTKPLSPDKYPVIEKMRLFSETIAEGRRRGFKRIRSDLYTNEIELATNYSVHDWLTDKQAPKNLRDNLYGMFILPFIKEGDEARESAYIESDYFFEDKDNGVPKTKCVGLASAWIYETLTVSLQSSPAWLKNKLRITITSGEGTIEENVPNVFSKNCFTTDYINSEIEKSGDVVLLESDIAPDKKKIHLADHHGRRELAELWDKLKNSPFVTEGRSTEWGGDTFYKKPQKDGKVDIVHLRSNRRYALQIQTTGRNLRETIAIAKKLEERYG